MSKRGFSRRAFLRGAGGISIALPLFASLQARAQGSPPKRFIAFYQANGVFTSEWFPQGSESSFTLGATHTPLQPFFNQLLSGEQHRHGGGGERFWRAAPAPAFGRVADRRVALGRKLRRQRRHRGRLGQRHLDRSRTGFDLGRRQQGAEHAARGARRRARRQRRRVLLRAVDAASGPRRSDHRFPKHVRRHRHATGHARSVAPATKERARHGDQANQLARIDARRDRARAA